MVILVGIEPFTQLFHLRHFSFCATADPDGPGPFLPDPYLDTDQEFSSQIWQFIITCM